MRAYDEVWPEYAGVEPEFEMRNIKWFKTTNGYIPFVENFDGTKIRVLTSGKSYHLIRKEVYDMITPTKKGMVLTYDKDLQTTITKATGLKGKIFETIDVLHEYFFNGSMKETVRRWVYTNSKTTTEIVKICNKINKKLTTATNDSKVY